MTTSWHQVAARSAVIPALLISSASAGFGDAHTKLAHSAQFRVVRGWAAVLIHTRFGALQGTDRRAGAHRSFASASSQANVAACQTMGVSDHFYSERDFG